MQYTLFHRQKKCYKDGKIDNIPLLTLTLKFMFSKAHVSLRLDKFLPFIVF